MLRRYKVLLEYFGGNPVAFDSMGEGVNPHDIFILTPKAHGEYQALNAARRICALAGVRANPICAVERSEENQK